MKSLDARRTSLVLAFGTIVVITPFLAHSQVPETGAGFLPLDAAIQTALTESPELAISVLEADGLQQVAPQAGTLPDPMVHFAVSPSPIHTARGSQRSQWKLEQALPFPGKRKLRRAVADLRAEAARHESKAVEQEVILGVRVAYAKLYALQQQLSVLADFRDEVRRFEEAAAAEYEVGRGPQQALLRAQLEKNSLGKRELRLRADWHEAVRNLAILMNRPAMMHDTVWVERPSGLEEITLAADFTVAVEQRPEFAAIDRAMDGADRAVSLARKDFLPDLTLQVTYTDIAKDSPPANPDGVDAVAIGAGIRIPLWRGALRARKEQREIERRQLDERHRALESDVRIRIDELRMRIRLENENLALLSGGLVPQAEITKDATLAAYTTGRVAFIDLLDAERMLFELRLDEIATRERLHVAVASMHRVLGTPTER